MKVCLNVRDIFDSNSEFELQMFQVFTAKNDLNMINLLLQKAEQTREYAFLFKIMLGILREAIMLIIKITNKYITEINEFKNRDEIQKNFDSFCDMNSGIGNDSFSFQVMSNIRNQVFHYKKTENIKEILTDLPDSLLYFELGNRIGEIEYNFTNELLYEYANKKWGEFSGNRDITEFIKKITSYSICVATLLDNLIIGFLDNNTNLFDETFDGDNLKRKS